MNMHEYAEIIWDYLRLHCISICEEIDDDLKETKIWNSQDDSRKLSGDSDLPNASLLVSMQLCL